MMRSGNILILSLCVVSLVWECFTSSAEDHYDPDDWIDPFDMVNFDQAAGKMTNKKEIRDPVPTTVPPEAVKKNGGMGSVHPPKSSQHYMKVNTKAEKVNSVKINGGMSSVNPQKSSQHYKEANTKAEKVKSVDFSDEDRQRKVMPSQQKPANHSQVYRTLYRKHVKMLMEKWDTQAGSGDNAVIMIISFSSQDVNLLRSFADTGEGHAYDVNEALQKMIVRVEPPHGYSEQGHLEYTLGISLPTVIQILSVLALLSVILWVEVTLQVCWRQKLVKLTGLLFFVSIPWTWYHMYKQEEAKRQSELMKDIPDVCVKKKMSFYEMAVEVARSTFTFSEDQCVKYYEHMLVDPVWKVAPTEAFAVTFVRFFVSPAKLIGQAVSEFLTGIFQNLPVTLWPIVVVCGMLIFILVLLFSFGYSVRLPFLLSIESSQSSSYKHRLEAATSENTLQKQTIEQLRDKLCLFEKERLSILAGASLHGTSSDISMGSKPVKADQLAQMSASDGSIKTSHSTSHPPVECLDHNPKSALSTAEPVPVLPIEDIPKKTESPDAAVPACTKPALSEVPDTELITTQGDPVCTLTHMDSNLPPKDTCIKKDCSSGESK